MNAAEQKNTRSYLTVIGLLAERRGLWPCIPSRNCFLYYDPDLERCLALKNSMTRMQASIQRLRLYYCLTQVAPYLSNSHDVYTSWLSADAVCQGGGSAAKLAVKLQSARLGVRKTFPADLALDSTDDAVDFYCENVMAKVRKPVLQKQLTSNFLHFSKAHGVIRDHVGKQYCLLCLFIPWHRRFYPLCHTSCPTLCHTSCPTRVTDSILKVLDTRS